MDNTPASSTHELLIPLVVFIRAPHEGSSWSKDLVSDHLLFGTRPPQGMRIHEITRDLSYPNEVSELFARYEVGVSTTLDESTWTFDWLHEAIDEFDFDVPDTPWRILWASLTPDESVVISGDRTLLSDGQTNVSDKDLTLIKRLLHDEDVAQDELTALLARITLQFG